jgi:hypothetical protein
MGIFAATALARGTVIGVYLGESLSQQAFATRHGPNAQLGEHVWDCWPHSVPPHDAAADLSDPIVAAAAAATMAAALERVSRLGQLTDGAPIGGANNNGSYTFELLPTHASYPSERVAYLDAEDPNLSSWCRYINHAQSGSRQCNCVKRIDALRARVWFETSRDVACGEELHFDYWALARDGGYVGDAMRWVAKQSGLI